MRTVTRASPPTADLPRTIAFTHSHVLQQPPTPHACPLAAQPTPRATGIKLTVGGRGRPRWWNRATAALSTGGDTTCSRQNSRHKREKHTPAGERQQEARLRPQSIMDSSASKRRLGLDLRRLTQHTASHRRSSSSSSSNSDLAAILSFMCVAALEVAPRHGCGWTTICSSSGAARRNAASELGQTPRHSDRR